MSKELNSAQEAAAWIYQERYGLDDAWIERIGRTLPVWEHQNAIPLYAAPIAAAPSVSVETLRSLSERWATDRSYTGSPVDDIRALIEQTKMSTPTAPVEYKVVAYQEITPTDDPAVFDAKIWAIGTGMKVPEGCTPLYWKVGE